MTTTTARFESASRQSRSRFRRGVTMVELMIAMGISATVMSSVVASFLFLARSSLLTTAYSGMDREARTGLEIFAREVRMASGISDFSANGMLLQIPSGPSGPYSVNYTYVPANKTFYRNYGVAGQRALMTGVEVFVLKRYSLQQDLVTGLPREATNDLETKQLQIQLRSVRVGAARATATNNVISARYILRNKVVSN